MKAIVLAGGHATRLWPITRNRAKPLLPLGEKPIIEFIVEEIEDEVDEVLISTNKKYADDFRSYLDEYGHENAHVVVESQGSEEEKPGTIGAIINLLDEENIEDDLLVVGGDNYQSFDGAEFLDFCRSKDSPCNAVFDVKEKEVASQLGVVDVDGDRITGFEEKPEEPPSTLGSIAWYFFPQQDLELFQRYENHFRDTDVPAERYLDEPGRLIEWAHRETDMYAFSFEGEWFDIGTPEGYLRANAVVTDGNRIDGEVRDSEIRKNCVIHQDAEVKDSVIEDTVVFPEACVEDSELRNTIVDRSAEVSETDLNDGLVGEHSQI